MGRDLYLANPVAPELRGPDLGEEAVDLPGEISRLRR
jgi:hypothetical protein